MSDIDEARRMLAIAQRDLRAVRAMVGNPDDFPDEVYGFLAQQAAEKAMKSWLALVAGDYPRVRDLEVLLQRLADAQAAVPEHFLGLADLADFAVQYRYSAFDDEPALEREKLLGSVEELLRHVENELARAESTPGGQPQPETTDEREEPPSS